MSIKTNVPQSLEQATITFQSGVLILRLREDINLASMEIHCTSATITRGGVVIRRSNIPHDPLKPEENIGPAYTAMAINEFTLLAAGVAKVQNFWDSDPLPPRHVLTACGCIVNWDSDEQTRNYRHPSHLQQWYYCEDHEVQEPLARFNEADFDATIPQKHTLLDDGCVIQWTPEITMRHETGSPYKYQWVICPTHNTSHQVASFNEADWPSPAEAEV